MRIIISIEYFTVPGESLSLVSPDGKQTPMSYIHDGVWKVDFSPVISVWLSCYFVERVFQRYSGDEKIPSVIYNEEKAAYDLTLRLLDYGNEKIGMITGPTESTHAVNRSRGHMKALFDRRIPYDPSLTLVGDWERDIVWRLDEVRASAQVQSPRDALEWLS